MRDRDTDYHGGRERDRDMEKVGEERERVQLHCLAEVH